MEQLINIISAAPEVVSVLPPDFFILLAGALGVNGLVQAAKKWLDLQNDKVIVMLTLTVSALAAAIPYFILEATKNPSAYGEYTLEILAICTVTYRVIQFVKEYLSRYEVRRRQEEAEEARIDALGTIETSPAPVLSPALATASPFGSSSSEFEG